MRPIKIFALNGTKNFGKQVAECLSIPLSSHRESQFHDGEVFVASNENVRGCDVYVIQSLYGDEQESVNDKLMKIIVFMGSLHDASASKVTAVIPYYCYARQDRKTSSRAPITTKYIAHMFQSVFAKRILTIDVHNPAVLQNGYSITHFDNLEASGLLAKYVAKELVKKNNINPEDLVILSPDEGRIKQSRKFRKFLQKKLNINIPIACVDKTHDNDIIEANSLIGSVKNKKVIILDDMISSGKTIIEAAKVAKNHQAESVLAVCATHGLFVSDSNNYLDNNFIENYVVTNTIPPFRLHNNNILNKLKIINLAQLFAEAIDSTHKGKSISNLIETNSITLKFDKPDLIESFAMN